MLVDNQRALFVVPVQSRKRKRRSSFFFSSSKALKRSRMTRGKKAVSKSSQASAIDLRKSQHFEGGDIGDEEDASLNAYSTLHEIGDISEDSGHGRKEGTVIVSFYTKYLGYMNSYLALIILQYCFSFVEGHMFSFIWVRCSWTRYSHLKWNFKYFHIEHMLRSI